MENSPSVLGAISDAFEQADMNIPNKWEMAFTVGTVSLFGIGLVASEINRFWSAMYPAAAGGLTFVTVGGGGVALGVAAKAAFDRRYSTAVASDSREETAVGPTRHPAPIARRVRPDVLIDQHIEDADDRSIAPSIDPSVARKQEWFKSLMLERALHLWVTSQTGGGKTTVMHWLAVEHVARGHEVIIISTHAKIGQFPGSWVVGTPSAVPLVCNDLLAELDARLVDNRGGTQRFPVLWILTDEIATLKDVEEFKELFGRVLQEGRKVNMHFGGFTQDSLVTNTGLKGLTGLITHFDVQFDLRAEQPDDKNSPRYWARVEGNQRDEVVAPQLPDPDGYVLDNGRTYNGRASDRIDPTLLLTPPSLSAPPSAGNLADAVEAAPLAPAGVSGASGADTTTAPPSHHPFAPPAPPQNGGAPVRNRLSQAPRPMAGAGTNERILDSMRALIDQLPEPSGIGKMTNGQVGVARMMMSGGLGEKYQSHNAVCTFLWGSKNEYRMNWVKEAVGSDDEESEIDETI